MRKQTSVKTDFTIVLTAGLSPAVVRTHLQDVRSLLMDVDKEVENNEVYVKHPVNMQTFSTKAGLQISELLPSTVVKPHGSQKSVGVYQN